MSWRDRDWAKFDEDEWNEIVQTTPASSGRRTTGVTLVAVLLSALALAVGAFVHLRPSAPRAHTPTQPINAISINWAPASLAVAATGGQICVTDPRYGQICSAYVAGQRPADALTQTIARRGLSVVAR
jgi:hypothetical protein